MSLYSKISKVLKGKVSFYMNERVEALKSDISREVSQRLEKGESVTLIDKDLGDGKRFIGFQGLDAVKVKEIEYGSGRVDPRPFLFRLARGKK